MLKRADPRDSKHVHYSFKIGYDEMHPFIRFAYVFDSYVSVCVLFTIYIETQIHVNLVRLFATAASKYFFAAVGTFASLYIPILISI